MLSTAANFALVNTQPEELDRAVRNTLLLLARADPGDPGDQDAADEDQLTALVARVARNLLRLLLAVSHYHETPHHHQLAALHLRLRDAGVCTFLTSVLLLPEHNDADGEHDDDDKRLRPHNQQKDPSQESEAHALAALARTLKTKLQCTCA